MTSHTSQLSVNGNGTRSIASLAKDKTQYYAYKNVVDMYVQYRPTYTQKLYDDMLNFARNSGCDFDFAVDVCCGSGQSSVPLAKHFNKVLGVDVSKPQIDAAPKQFSNLTFRVSAGEDLTFVASGTVSLLTVGTGFHWLDTNRFLKEADRVLKPGGILVIYGYDDCVPEDPNLNQLFKYYRDEVLANHWHKEYKMLAEGYHNVPCPFPTGWKRNDTIILTHDWNIDQFTGHLGSLSPFNQYQIDHSDSNIYDDFKKSFLNNCTDQQDSELKLYRINFPLFMIMTQKPSQ